MTFKTQATPVFVLSLLFSVPLFSTPVEQTPEIPADTENVSQEDCPTQATKSAVTLDYHDPLSFMQDFIDLSKKPNAKITYWAEQLAELLKRDLKLKAFGQKVLEKAEKEKNPVLRTQAIKQLFLDYQNKFSATLRNYIIANFAKVRTALDKRIAKS